jgi:L-asparaginase II
MLAKAGVDVRRWNAARTGPITTARIKAMAAAGQAPSALHNNCSGKHAGFVCLGCLMAEQRKATTPRLPARLRQARTPGDARGDAALQAATGYDLAHTAVGTDGCSIPTYAIPLCATWRRPSRAWPPARA